MINVRSVLVLLTCVALLLVPGARPEVVSAQTATTMRLRMLYPRGSSNPWGIVFPRWASSLRTASGGTLELDVQSSGFDTDEATLVRQIGAGEIECASLSAAGLHAIDRSLLALQAPGVIQSEAQLDAVRTALDSQLRQQFANNGMVLMGWSDLGRARIFSTHAITSPSDLRTSHPWQLPNDPVFGELLSRAGATGVPLPLARVLPALTAGQVDTVAASASAVSALQWHTRVTHVMSPSSAVLVGATVCSKPFYDRLTAAQRTALDTTAAQAHTLLRTRIQRDDAAAYAQLISRGMVEDDATSHDAEWRTLAEQTRDALVGRLYTRAQLDAVIAAARGH